MKKIITLLSSLCIYSCSHLEYKEIGTLSMAATRNVETNQNYSLIRSYMGGSKDELKNSKAANVKEALENTVAQTPGGEFLKNVVIYLVAGKYYAVSGDVWGISANQQYRGYKVGDKVRLHKNGPDYTITELKDNKKCLIKEDGNGKVKEANYDDLLKSY
ncbi:MAG: hypothetical protein JST67_00075 [Bacteroidetes bacterium]|nr:hypothetical protein [Bacteroidota bacterium]